MSVIFEYGAMTVTMNRDPAMENYSLTRKWMSPSIRSGGGTMFVYDKSIVKTIADLTWKHIDQTDLENLLSFLDAVGGNAETFNYTDPKGNLWEAQYWGPPDLRWTPVELMMQEFTITLSCWSAFYFLALEGGVDRLIAEHSEHLMAEY